MSLPYQIADTIAFVPITCDGAQHNLVEASDVNESVIDVQLRSDPANAVARGSDANAPDMGVPTPADPTLPSTWIFVGSVTNPRYPLLPNQSINIRVTRRSGLAYKGPLGHVLHMVTAQISKSIPPGGSSP